MAAYDAIIIGMGAAGCAAASTLCRAKKKVLGLEAQDRIGGRVHTVSLGEGVVELGAEWIHGQKQNLTYKLAMEHKVPLLSQDLTLDMYRSDGTKANSAAINRLVECALENIKHPPEEPGPLGEFLTDKTIELMKQEFPQLLEDKQFLPQFLKFLELIVCNYDPSDGWNDISTHNKYETTEGDPHLSFHELGYHTFFDILLNTYDHGAGFRTLDLYCDKVVTGIDWTLKDGKSVYVTCEDGSEYRGDIVIVTLSVGVLKALHKYMFCPPLPPAKVQAIEALTIGTMNKIVLRFPSAWWPEGSTAFGFLWLEEDRLCILPDDQWMTNVFGATVPKGCETALTLWTSGEAARHIETLCDEVLKHKCMDLLWMFMGRNGVIPDPIEMVRSNWHSNPYTRGSYTYDSVTSPESPHARDDLAQPLHDEQCVPRVLFAGEACHNTHFSTVHGAAATGWREAYRFIEPKEVHSDD